MLLFALSCDESVGHLLCFIFSTFCGSSSPPSKKQESGDRVHAAIKMALMASQPDVKGAGDMQYGSKMMVRWRLATCTSSAPAFPFPPPLALPKKLMMHDDVPETYPFPAIHRIFTPQTKARCATDRSSTH